MKRKLLSIIFINLLTAHIGYAQPESATPGSLEKQISWEGTKLPVLAPGVYHQTISLPSGELMRYTIFIPPNLKRKADIPLIVALHYGYPETKPTFWGGAFMDVLINPAFENLNAVIVAPDSIGSGPWTTQTNQQAVNWLTQSIIKSYKINRKKVLLTGFSMGAIGTWFIGNQLQDLFTAAILLEGKPLNNKTKWTIPVYVIHSRKDEVFPFELTEKYVEKIKADGANVELKIVDDLKHHEAEKYIPLLKESQLWLNRVWK